MRESRARFPERRVTQLTPVCVRLANSFPPSPSMRVCCSRADSLDFQQSLSTWDAMEGKTVRCLAAASRGRRSRKGRDLLGRERLAPHASRSSADSLALSRLPPEPRVSRQRRRRWRERGSAARLADHHLHVWVRVREAELAPSSSAFDRGSRNPLQIEDLTDLIDPSFARGCASADFFREDQVM